MTKTHNKVPITARALTQRIDAALRTKGLRLRAGVGAQRAALGAHYILNTKTNGVQQRNVDLEKLAQQLGVMQEWEEVR